MPKVSLSYNAIDKKPKSHHIFGFDTIRFFAASLAVFCHIEITKHFQGLPALVSEQFIYESGKLLVASFFVVSGFLITMLLLKEKESSGTINLLSFYARRGLRILPLYYIIILLIFFVLPHFSIFYLPAQSEDLQQHFLLKFIFSIVLLPQMLLVKYQHIPLGGQLWTVGVEVVFYLLWPLVLRKSKNELSLAIGLIISIITMKLLLYNFSDYLLWEKHTGLLYKAYLIFYYNRLDCLLLGAIPAILIHRKNSTWLSLVTNRPYTAIVLFFLIVLYVFGLKLIRIDYFYYALFFTWLLSSVSLLQNDKLFRALRFTERMGKASYGIYLWHFIMLFIAFYVQRQIFPATERNSIGANALLYFSTYLLTYGMSVLSFYFFESPFLKLKERLNL